MPVIDGSTTASTAAAVTAASIALPPSCIAFSPAADASGWLVAIMPCLPYTTDRVACGLAAGRSPGRGRWSSCAPDTAATKDAAIKPVARRFIDPPRKSLLMCTRFFTIEQPPAVKPFAGGARLTLGKGGERRDARLDFFRFGGVGCRRAAG